MVFGAVSVAALVVLSRLRTPDLRVDDRQRERLARALSSHVPYLEPVAEWLKNGFATAVDVLAVAVRRRVGAEHPRRHADRLVGAVARAEAVVRRSPRSRNSTRPPTPVRSRRFPVRLHDVTFRYPNADHDALGPVTLTVEPGEHVAVTGVNGSGQDDADAGPGRAAAHLGNRRAGQEPSGWAGSVAPRWSCSTRRARSSAPASPTTWCGGLPPGQSTDVDRILEEVGPGRPRRARHRRAVRRRAAAAGGGGRARAGAVAADRRRGDEHGRPAWPRLRCSGCSPGCASATEWRWCRSRTTTTRPTRPSGS